MENFNYKGFRAANILKSFQQNFEKGGVGSGPHKEGEQRKEPTHGYTPDEDWKDEHVKEQEELKKLESAYKQIGNKDSKIGRALIKKIHELKNKKD